MQVVRPIGFEHLNESMVQNSKSTCKHNPFEVIQGKKILVRPIAMHSVLAGGLSKMTDFDGKGLK